MAQPIPLEIAPRNVRKELRDQLESAPDDHAEAMLAAFELLQEMHDQGLLDMARGVLSTRDQILGTLAADASTPEAVRAIRNLLFWMRVLGSIDSDCFQAIFKAIPEGLAMATAPRQEPVTLFGLLRRFTGKDSLRAMAAAADFLEAFGRHLHAAACSTPRSTSP